MRSQKPGKNTLGPEILNISKHGFWLFVNNHEYFLAFQEFPWFKEATISSLLKVTLPSEGHLYWQDLDVDLELESLEHPEKYPLTYLA